MAYKKHQLYLGNYEIKDGVINLPDGCNWLVMQHIDGGNFVNPGEEKSDICLILNETRTETSGFWPVMSFLTKAEARQLRDQLDKCLK